MVEEQRSRVENAMTKMIGELDREYLRKMQALMHRCAAACCDDLHSSSTALASCVDRCQAPVHAAQGYVQGEMERIQARMQRCVMACNDDVRDQMPASPSEQQVSQYSRQFESCAGKCVDQYVSSLPSALARMKQALAQGQYKSPA